MNKAFTKEIDPDDDELVLPALPAGGKNYITPQGYERLRVELLDLIDSERPKIVEIVHWAASNGDRSENGDYHYGKKRLREIDRRIRFLTKRLEIAEISNPSIHYGSDQVFFGATVTYADDSGGERTITILGIDEANSALGQVSWISPDRLLTLLSSVTANRETLAAASVIRWVTVSMDRNAAFRSGELTSWLTAVTARVLIAIVENFQNEDASIAVPSVLEEFGAPRGLAAPA